MLTDIHMEAYLPIQAATIAFEVGKGLVPKSKAEKYQTHFMKRIIHKMEKNALDVVNP
jgi:hypothetical protein